MSAYRVTLTGSDLRHALEALKPAFPKKARAIKTKSVFMVSLDQMRIGLPGAEVARQAVWDQHVFPSNSHSTDLRDVEKDKFWARELVAF